MSDEVALARIEERLAGVIHRLSGLETVLELRSETIERHNREALANAHDISTIKLSASKDGNSINKIEEELRTLEQKVAHLETIVIERLEYMQKNIAEKVNKSDFSLVEKIVYSSAGAILLAVIASIARLVIK